MLLGVYILAIHHRFGASVESIVEFIPCDHGHEHGFRYGFPMFDALLEVENPTFGINLLQFCADDHRDVLDGKESVCGHSNLPIVLGRAGLLCH